MRNFKNQLALPWTFISHMEYVSLIDDSKYVSFTNFQCKSYYLKMYQGQILFNSSGKKTLRCYVQKWDTGYKIFSLFPVNKTYKLVRWFAQTKADPIIKVW